MSTNFPNGLESYGIPLMGGSGTLSKMGGQGKVFFVDPALGSNSNTGTAPDAALDTVAAAYALCTDKSGDTIYLLNDGTTSGSSREAGMITWAKNNVHLVGLCAPVGISQRARITPVVDAALTEAPVIDITGSGNIFANVQIAHFGADTNTIGCRGVDLSGHRNYFYNVHIVGVPNAHSGDETDSCDLLIDGGSENTFNHCTIGIDTIPRSASNCNIEFTTAATRNVFEDCIVQMLSDAGDSLFIKADGVGDLDRWTLFKNCVFINDSESGGYTVMTIGMDINQAAGGMVIFENSNMYGVTDVAVHGTGPAWTSGVAGTTTGTIGVVTS